MPKKKMSNADIAIWVFLILGALGLYKTAGWWFEHIISPIGDFISYLEWALSTRAMDPMQILVSFIILVIGLYLANKIKNIVFERIREFLSRVRDFFNL